MAEKSGNSARKPSTPTIGIVGLGPIGSILAVLLQEVRCRVVVCDRDIVRLHQIRQKGIRLTGIWNKSCQPYAVVATLDEVADHQPYAVFFAVKAYHLADLADQITVFRQQNGSLPWLISAQNGIDVEAHLTKATSKQRVLRMVINFAGNVQEDGTIRVNFFIPPNFLGNPWFDQLLPGSIQLSEWLSQAGAHTVPLAGNDLLREVWKKTLLNASISALSAVSQLPMKTIMENPALAEIVEETLREGIRVATALGIDIPEDFLTEGIAYLSRAGNHLPSLAVDFLNRRPTEIDFLNGKICAYAREKLIRVPLNQAFTAIIRALTGQTPVVPHPSSLPHQPATQYRVAFLGIDLGTTYTKFCVIDEQGRILFTRIAQVYHKDQVSIHHVLHALQNHFRIQQVCITGYGQRYFPGGNLRESEALCAAHALHVLHPNTPKTIIDIGGESIRVIHTDPQGNIERVAVNDPCAAGAGTFLVEATHHYRWTTHQMNQMAAQSTITQELNTVCTVFARSEAIQWLMAGRSQADLARGIYLSILGRIQRLQPDLSRPVYLIGGVPAHHPFFVQLASTRWKTKVIVPENPQIIVAYGAALRARHHWQTLRTTTQEQPASQSQ